MNPANTVSIIQTHGAVQPLFEAMLPTVERLKYPVQVVYPSDDLCPHVWPSAALWKSGRTGIEGRERSVNVLRWFVESDYDYCGIFEYDSLCLGLSYCPRRGLHGIMCNQNPGNPVNPDRWIATRYVLAPWTLDKESARHMLRVADCFTDIWEEGNQDRLFAAWAHIAGVPILPHSELSLGVTEITPAMVPAIRSAGVKWIHGVKNEEILKTILASA